MSLADIRLGLVAFLLADASISASVQSTAHDLGVYPIRLPQGRVKPSIVYSRISGVGDHHNEGPTGLARPRIQIDAWAQKADQASILADQVKARIDGFKGSMVYGNAGAEVIVQGVFFDSEREDYDDGAKLYRASRDYLIWFEER
jgi:hypothetical protein